MVVATLTLSAAAGIGAQDRNGSAPVVISTASPSLQGFAVPEGGSYASGHSRGDVSSHGRSTGTRSTHRPGADEPGDGSPGDGSHDADH